MKFLIVFFATLTAIALAKPCYPRCRYKFCDDSTMFNTIKSKPNRPFTGTICSIDGKYQLGTVDSSGESLIKTDKNRIWPFTKISQFKPKGLRQSFSPSFLKTYSVPGYYYTNKFGKHFFDPKRTRGKYIPHKYSAVGRETSQQGQLKFLRRQCIILPFTKFQLLDKYGRHVIKNVHSKDYLKDCVAFTLY